MGTDVRPCRTWKDSVEIAKNRDWNNVGESDSEPGLKGTATARGGVAGPLREVSPISMSF